MTNLMYDSVTVADLPSGGWAYASYVDGRFDNWSALVARFLKSGAHLLSITVNGDDWAMAHAIDDEPGDEDNVQAAQFALARISLKSVPVIYTSASNLVALGAALTAVGVARSKVLIWSAHYTSTPHFCATHTCGYGFDVPADATQYSDQGSSNYDTSLVSPTFFDSWAPPVPPVVPPAKPVLPPGQWNNPDAWTWAEVSIEGTGLDGHAYTFAYDKTTNAWVKA